MVNRSEERCQLHGHHSNRNGHSPTRWRYVVLRTTRLGGGVLATIPRRCIGGSDLVIESTSPFVSPVTHLRMTVRRHPTYYFQDGSIIFLVCIYSSDVEDMWTSYQLTPTPSSSRAKFSIGSTYHSLICCLSTSRHSSPFAPRMFAKGRMTHIL